MSWDVADDLPRRGLASASAAIVAAMQIRTLSDAPFVVDVLPFRRVADQWQLAVVCKATFDIGDDDGEPTCRPAREPTPVLAAEVYE